MTTETAILVFGFTFLAGFAALIVSLRHARRPHAKRPPKLFPLS